MGPVVAETVRDFTGLVAAVARHLGPRLCLMAQVWSRPLSLRRESSLLSLFMIPCSRAHAASALDLGDTREQNIMDLRQHQER